MIEELKAQSMGDMTGSNLSQFFVTVQPCVIMRLHDFYLHLSILLTMQPITTTKGKIITTGKGKISILNRSRVEVPVKWVVVCFLLCFTLLLDCKHCRVQLSTCILYSYCDLNF